MPEIAFVAAEVSQRAGFEQERTGVDVNIAAIGLDRPAIKMQGCAYETERARTEFTFYRQRTAVADMDQYAI